MNILTTQQIQHIIREQKRNNRITTTFTTITQNVLKIHNANSGRFVLIPDFKKRVHTALSNLQKYGHAYHINTERWELPKYKQRIFGHGEQFVYLYYYPTYKQSAADKGEKQWRCKIGKATQAPEKAPYRCKTTLPETPVMPLLIRTQDCQNLEKLIHASLTLQGKHITEDIPGTEWFLTNPDEIVQLYTDLERIL